MQWLIASSLVLFATTVCGRTDPVPRKSEIVKLNGSDIYYEVYRQGEPLILLHGYFTSSRSWAAHTPYFSSAYEVYVVDLKGHGKSSPYTETLSIKAAAADVAALLKYLGLERVKAIGYSYGGDVLYHLNLINPDIVQSMITVGACGTWDAKEYPEFVDYFSWKNVDNLQWMYEHHQNEEQIRAILEQVPNYKIMISEEEIKAIKAKTLIVCGDSDFSITMECLTVLHNNLPDSQLWILPGTGHDAHSGVNLEAFVTKALDFFSH